MQTCSAASEHCKLLDCAWRDCMQWPNGVRTGMRTSMRMRSASRFSRSTRIVTSQHRRITPSTPAHQDPGTKVCHLTLGSLTAHCCAPILRTLSKDQSPGWGYGGNCSTDAQAAGGSRTGDAEAVDDVAGEAEGHHLGRRQEAALLEGDAQVDVHHVRRALVDQDVVAVPVPQPDDVTCDLRQLSIRDVDTSFDLTRLLTCTIAPWQHMRRLSD